jgi:hypothetical protein
MKDHSERKGRQTLVSWFADDFALFFNSRTALEQMAVTA